jgi:hypothetical protein
MADSYHIGACEWQKRMIESVDDQDKSLLLWSSQHEERNQFLQTNSTKCQVRVATNHDTKMQCKYHQHMIYQQYLKVQKFVDPSL